MLLAKVTNDIGICKSDCSNEFKLLSPLGQQWVITTTNLKSVCDLLNGNVNEALSLSEFAVASSEAFQQSMSESSDHKDGFVDMPITLLCTCYGLMGMSIV